MWRIRGKMRQELAKINNERTHFSAIFERYGTKSGWKGYPERTILLRNVRNDIRVVADHIWFTMTKGFDALGELRQGDKVEFHARVKEYVKGYINNREDIDESEIDYKLSHPTKISRIANFDTNENLQIQAVSEQGN
jgi:hypothetical protein